jgi:tetratricopeptide (TPR) repeat protein
MRLVWLLFVPFLAPVTAVAQTDGPVSDEARQRFELAARHFDQGDFASALTEWQRVYALLDGHPNREFVAYNMARANEQLGRNREALELYERYLAATEGRADAPNRPEAQRHAQELRLRLQLAEEDTGGEAGAFAPSPVGITVGAIGVASVIAGGIVGGLALAQDGSARADCEGSRCTPEAYAAIGDAHTLAAVSDGLLWGGLAVAAAGLVLVFVLSGGNEGTAASAACDREGCMAVVGGSF